MADQGRHVERAFETFVAAKLHELRGILVAEHQQHVDRMQAEIDAARAQRARCQTKRHRREGAAHAGGECQGGLGAVGEAPSIQVKRVESGESSNLGLHPDANGSDDGAPSNIASPSPSGMLGSSAHEQRPLSDPSVGRSGTGSRCHRFQAPVQLRPAGEAPRVSVEQRNSEARRTRGRVEGGPRLSLRRSLKFTWSLSGNSAVSCRSLPRCDAVAPAFEGGPCADSPLETPAAGGADASSINSDQSAVNRFSAWPAWAQMNSTWSGWGNRAPGVCIQNSATSSWSSQAGNADDEDLGMLSNLFRRLLRVSIIHQNSAPRMVWDLIGIAMITYDFLVTPLRFLDLPETTCLSAMEWVVRLYWTADFPLAFLTGYGVPLHRATNPWQVLRRYARTWMLFDITLLTCAWLELASQHFQSLGTLRAVKVPQILQGVRPLRLLEMTRFRRCLKLPPTLDSMLRSELFEVISDITRIMLVLLAATHVLACCWYGVGRSTQGPSWVAELGMDRESLGHRYATSVHWAVGQITGAADITPTNIWERVYAAFTLLCGFIVSASAVAGITSSLTRLQLLTAHKSRQLAMLRQYLFDKGISSRVSSRVQRNAMLALAEEEKNVQESNIELLALVSEPLRMEVHYEINQKILTLHPFFECLDEANNPAMRRICHAALSHLTLYQGDVMFHAGEVPYKPGMYFCLSGTLKYTPDLDEEARESTMQAGQWACEAALWTQWSHFGTLCAESQCMFLCLDLESLQGIAQQFRRRTCHAARYAQAFVRELNAMCSSQLTDIHLDIPLVQLCEAAFGEDAPRWRVANQSERRSNARRTAMYSSRVGRIGIPQSHLAAIESLGRGGQRISVASFGSAAS